MDSTSKEKYIQKLERNIETLQGRIENEKEYLIEYVKGDRMQTARNSINRIIFMEKEIETRTEILEYLKEE